MDESWRMHMGLTPNLPRRRSTEDTSSDPTRRFIFNGSGSEPETLDPDDFADVFGGPPRTLLAHKFSRSTTFYEDIFRPSDFISAAKKNGRSLPAFKVPTKAEEFYSDIFGSEDDRRSRERSGLNSKAKSKSNSSSVLSSEELSPLRKVTGDDVALSTFASKLRPINVPYRWNSSTVIPEEHPKKQRMPAFPCNRPSFEYQYQENEYREDFGSSYFGFSRRLSSPETISVDPNSYRSIKISMDDWELNSCSSAGSSICQDPEVKTTVQDPASPEQVTISEEDEDMSSYVIEVTSNLREEESGAEAIDEAIAWAKEKFQSQNSDKNSNLRHNDNKQSADLEGRPDASVYHNQLIDGHGNAPSPKVEQNNWTSEVKKQPQKDNLQTELEQLDKDIRMWSAGKESDIRLLLSTLNHILWTDCSWHAIPLLSLIESSQVKKAYQKARLCLHPDKLQQRGATIQQKYIAEKAFSILQDAWAAFISQDVFFN
ncbi:Auxilin-like protein 1 [Quillaja saponaria]|uniref:Auxilin-like protein 1 n=1 Tax=Quillaja saponaria TaxID=32244 RepID=A0AAD7M2X1_QUISA|nr:Auxilin-like protein 1 [Quillaja saponaria]